MDNLAAIRDLGFPGGALEFAVNGSEAEVEQTKQLPSLSAQIVFQNVTIQGSHEGERIMVDGDTSIFSFWMQRFSVQADGRGAFISPQFTYHGGFHQGKMHDTSGTCLLGSTQRYVGGFEDGHLSGRGVLEILVEGRWCTVHEGQWVLSRPTTGRFHTTTAGAAATASAHGDSETAASVRPPPISAGLTQKKPLPKQTAGKLPSELIAYDHDAKFAALLSAIAAGQDAEVQALLVDRDLMVNAADQDGCTPLMKASEEGRTSIVQLLLADFRVDANLRDRNGLTALMKASEGGHTSTVQALLANQRIKVNMQDKNTFAHASLCGWSHSYY